MKLGIIVGQPWDLIKVRLQAGIATGSAWQTGLEIFKKEGMFTDTISLIN